MEASVTRNIIDLYENAGFRMQETQHSRSMRFYNQFSVHFVFLFDSISELQDEWEARHTLLSEDYLHFTGPRDLEWNYYAVFAVNCEDGAGNGVFEYMRTIIEANTSYSRKYVVHINDSEQYPPGRVYLGDESDVILDPSAPIALWEQSLGERLFKVIVNGPKNSIGNRLKDLIVEE